MVQSAADSQEQTCFMLLACLSSYAMQAQLHEHLRDKILYELARLAKNPTKAMLNKATMSNFLKAAPQKLQLLLRSMRWESETADRALPRSLTSITQLRQSKRTGPVHFNLISLPCGMQVLHTVAEWQLACITKLSLVDMQLGDICCLKNLPQLTGLLLRNVNLTEMDIGELTALTSLEIHQSMCSRPGTFRAGNKLQYLRIYNSDLCGFKLEHVAKCTALETLLVGGTILEVNSITLPPSVRVANLQVDLCSIQTTSGSALEELTLRSLQLRDLDVSNSTLLRSLMIRGSFVSTLDLTSNTSLKSLNCSLSSTLQTLKLPSSIQHLDCHDCPALVLPEELPPQLTVQR